MGMERIHTKKRLRPLHKQAALLLRVILLAALVWGTAAGAGSWTAWALNAENTSGGGKPVHFAGYKYLNDHQLQIWFDKGAGASTVAGMFRVYEGSGTGGRQLAVSSLGAGTGANHSITGLSSGASFILNTAAGNTDAFQPEQTYTVMISTTVRANNNISLGAFNGNRDVVFSFTVPSVQGDYGAGLAAEVHDGVNNGATAVPVEGNIWFSVNMPVSNAEQVKSGMVLRENGNVIPFDPTIDGTPQNGARSYAPQSNNDGTYFFLPMTGGGGTSVYDLSLDASYSLDIPAMTAVNGQVIPARTVSFHTSPVDVPGTMTTALTAGAAGGKLQLGFSQLANVSGYNIYASSNPYWGFQKVNAAPVQSTAWDVSGLNQGDYYFRVAGVTDGGEGGFSPYVQGTVPQPSTAEPVPHWVNGSLTSSALSATGAALQWSGAVDDEAVTGYALYQNGSRINPETVTGTTYAISGLVPSTSYTYKVEAIDAGGRISSDGPLLQVTTLAAGGTTPPTGGSNTPVPDSIPPSFPAGSIITAEKTAQLEADVSWTAATDNVAVTGYKIYLDSNSAPAYTCQGDITSFHATGLPTGPHTIRVQAVDAAGNKSANGPSGALGGDSAASFSVTMTVLAKEPDNTVLQFDFTNGIDTTLSSVLQKTGLYESGSGSSIGYASQQYVKQGTDWDTSVEKLRRLTLTYTGLKDNTAYNVKMPASVTANNGNTLGRDYSWSFVIGKAAAAPTGAGGPGGAITAGEAASGLISLMDAGELVEKDGKKVIELQKDKLQERLEDPDQQALSLQLDEMLEDGTAVQGIRVPPEVLVLLIENKKPLVLAASGATWQLPASGLNGQAELELDWALPGLASLPGLPSGTVTHGVHAYSLTGGSGGSLPASVLLLSLPVPKDTTDTELLAVYRLNDAGTGWEYAGGRTTGDTLLVRDAKLGTYLVVESNRTYADIAGHWSRHAIEVLAARQIVDGVDDSRFAPDLAVTRAEFASLLARMLKLPEAPSDSGFADVAPGSWFRTAVNRAAAAGIIQGDGAGFRPGDTVTREEMAVMIERAYLYGGGGTPAGEDAAAAPFRDQASFGAWSASAIAHVHRLNIVEGQEDGGFSPAAPATRAEGAAMLLRLMDKLGL